MEFGVRQTGTIANFTPSLTPSILLPSSLRFMLLLCSFPLDLPLDMSPHVSLLTHFFSPIFLLIPSPLSLSLVPLPMFPCSFSPSLVWCQLPYLWFVSSLPLPLVLSPSMKASFLALLPFFSFLALSLLSLPPPPPPPPPPPFLPFSYFSFSPYQSLPCRGGKVTTRCTLGAWTSCVGTRPKQIFL